MTAQSAQAYGFGTTLDLSFDEAITKTEAALKEQGFGVLTRIDVKETLKQKIDVDFERYVILGACNPRLAHRGLQAEHDLGLLLPCNVIVHEHDGRVAVSVVDPEAMLGVVNQDELRAIATEAKGLLQRAVTSLEGTSK